MSILFVGDVVGKVGRDILVRELPHLIEEHQPQITIVNCENAAAGFGVTPKICAQLYAAGANVLTSGNHIWDRKEIFEYIDNDPNLIRPGNYPSHSPGKGYTIFSSNNGARFAVINLMGQVFMGATLDSPFTLADKMIDELTHQVDYIFVDFHAEVTSEKQALGWYLDGRITALVGTHTHVPTADDRLLLKGSAYISDVGMTGAYHSIIGMSIEHSISRFINRMPQRLEVPEGPAQLNAVIIEIEPVADKSAGNLNAMNSISASRSIKRIQITEN